MRKKLSEDQGKRLINVISRKMYNKNETIISNEILKVNPSGDMDLSDYINIVLTSYNAVLANFLIFMKDYSLQKDNYIINTSSMIDAFASNLKGVIKDHAEMKQARTIN